MQTINDFHGKYRFLSNFWPCTIVYMGLTYKSTEAAYQAAKTYASDRDRFTKYNPTDSKHAGGKNAKKYGFPLIHAPANWDSELKLKVMEDLVDIKFSKDPEKNLLLATGDAILIEGNVWHDNFWGDCSCQRCSSIIGLNHLGLISMRKRERLVVV